MWLLTLAGGRPSRRNQLWLLTGLSQPLAYLRLFAPLLKNLTGSPGFPRTGAYNVFTPGLLIIIALYSASFVGFNLIDWLRSGMLERLRVTPVTRRALLGRLFIRDVLLLLVQGAR